MVECPSYAEQRVRDLGANVALREALGDGDTAQFGEQLYKFLVEINIFKKI